MVYERTSVLKGHQASKSTVPVCLQFVYQIFAYTNPLCFCSPLNIISAGTSTVHPRLTEHLGSIETIPGSYK